jgi:hypothetical protein
MFDVSEVICSSCSAAWRVVVRASLDRRWPRPSSTDKSGLALEQARRLFLARLEYQRFLIRTLAARLTRYLPFLQQLAQAWQNPAAASYKCRFVLILLKRKGAFAKRTGLVAAA